MGQDDRSRTRQNGSESSRHRESRQSNSYTNYAIDKPTNQQIARDVAYTHQTHSTTSYPSQLAVDEYYSSYNAQPRQNPAQEVYFDEVTRSWVYRNTEARRAVQAAPSDTYYYTPPAPTSQSYSDRARAMDVEKRRVTPEKLEILGHQGQAPNGMERWEQEKASTAPWNGVGFVENGGKRQ